MDFELDDEQRALQAAASELLADHASSVRVRAVADGLATGGDRTPAWDAELWKAMVDQGWTGVAVADEAGGLGLGWVEAAVLLEAVGAHVAPAPILGQLVALDSLATTAWGTELLAGDAVACVAGSGAREVVPYAPSARVAVGIDGSRLVGVALDGDDRPAREPAMDVTREVGWLDVAARAAASGEVVEIGGNDAIERFVDVGALAYSAELLGASQRMLDVTVAYANDRVQFGKPIGSFQAVKHRCADMLVDVEGMRSAVYWAAWCLATDHHDRSIAASTAKTWCSDASRRVMASALQVHGGIGFTWEHDLHLYLKRAQLDALCFGDATWHRARLATMLRSRVEAGESVL
jgi:alkylation response protein AidB-like acyl-CoA dehydrogenase